MNETSMEKCQGEKKRKERRKPDFSISLPIVIRRDNLPIVARVSSVLRPVTTDFLLVGERG